MDKVSWTSRKIKDFCRPRQWPTIQSGDLLESGFPVYGANGQIGFYDKFNHEDSVVAGPCRGAPCGEINWSPERAYVTGNAMGLDDGDECQGTKKYLYYVLQLGAVYKIISGSAQPQIIASSLGNLLLEFPPLPEQKKIAEILGACDEAIEAQERLIAQKQQRKKGLMQQLLTGKKRFPQFVRSEKMVSSRFFDYPEDWSFVKIKDIADQVIRRNSYGELPVLSCTKHSGLVDSLSYFKKQVFAEDTSGYKVVEQGEFAFATNHLEEGSIGYQNLYERAIISPIYCVFKTRNTVDDSWLFPLVKTELYRHIFEANTNASVNRRGSIRWKEFKSIHVALPSVEEQIAIASVLSACDEEIDLQQNKLEQLKQQKKGLMQQLLTGKVRVKV